MSAITQLALSVQLPDDETFTSYKSITNHGITTQLKSFIEQSQLNQINSFYLFGLPAVGKSHLLHACSAHASQLSKSSVCLSCLELIKLPVEVLDGLENIDIICLDDIHLIAGNTLWQQAVFDLYNRVVEHDKCLIITGAENISQLGISLPDLVSRLSWGYSEQMKELKDSEKTIALQYRANQRGLMLADDVVAFLLSRLSRDMNSLIKVLDTLDKASIREQRKITIPFIKDVLEIKRLT